MQRPNLSLCRIIKDKGGAAQESHQGNFTLIDRDNQDSTNVLDKLTVIGIQVLLDKLEYEKKGT